MKETDSDSAVVNTDTSAAETTETGCCPRFDPEPWQDRELSWEGKLFVKDRVCAFFHMPLNFGGVMRRNMPKLQEAEALPEAPIVLAEHNSLFGFDLYIEVTQDVPDLKTVTLSGNYLTRVYEGPYKNMRKWMDDLKQAVAGKQREMKRLLAFYTTCPKCAKAYGKNYVVLFAELK